MSVAVAALQAGIVTMQRLFGRVYADIVPLEDADTGQKVPKYSRPEIERRWLVEPVNLPSLAGLSVRRITDQYLDGGHLRLRVVEEDGARPIYKLGKKYPAETQGPKNVVTIYLTQAEHATLAVLPGRSVCKLRYVIAGGSLDVYEQPSLPFAIFEAEFASREEALSFEAPVFVGEEVTFNEKYSGFNLAAPKRPPPPFVEGQMVEVILNARNTTYHKGTIRSLVWHFKTERWTFFLEENGKKVSKRYEAQDLRAIES